MADGIIEMSVRSQSIRGWRRISLAVLCGLLASACASAAERDADQRGDTGRESVELTEQEFRNERVDLFVLTPLVSALGIDPNSSRAYAIATMSSLEDDIARCMKERGFAYTPHITPDDVGATWLPALSRERFAELHGFGSRLDPVAVARDGLELGDPNEGHLESMSHVEQAAWRAALAGTDGCEAEGSIAVWGDAEQGYSALAEQARREVNSHVEMQQAADEYLACTRAAGYAWLNNPANSRLLGAETAIALGMTLEDERAAADANLGCLYATEQTRRSIAYEVETRLVDDHSELISEVREIFGTLVGQ